MSRQRPEGFCRPLGGTRSMNKEESNVSTPVHHGDGVSRGRSGGSFPGGTTSRLAIGWLSAVLALSVSVGCERWPWEAKSEAVSPPASGQPTTAQPSGYLPVPSQEQVALVNQTPLSTTDVELSLLEVKRFVQAAQQEWKPLPVQDLPDQLDVYDVMENLIEAELKAQDARARGVDRQASIQRRFRYLERSFYAQEWERWQREHATPTAQEIRQFYEQNKAGFVDPERVRVRQIVTQTVTEAEAVRTKAVQGTDFAQLARDFSMGAGKEQGGAIGWHLRAMDKERLRLIGGSPMEEVFFPQLEPIAFALEQHQISQPVKGPDGRYYIVELEDRKPAREQTELEVHDTVKELLTAQKIQQALTQLRSKAKLDKFPEHLSSVQQ